MRTIFQLCVQLATIRRVRVYAVAFVALSSALPTRAATPQEIFKLVSPSVVFIEAHGDSDEENFFGSGVVIGRGVIATNCHIVENAREIDVSKGRDIWRATISVAERARDVCQLSVPGLPLKPVELRSLPGVEVGETVYAIGAPQGLDLTLTAGLVSSIRTIGGFDYIQSSAPIDTGSSGGGLFDSAGRLLGITMSFVKDARHLTFVIPIDAYLEAARQPREPAKPEFKFKKVAPTDAPKPSSKLEREAESALNKRGRLEKERFAREVR